jgi:hypothetical protein
VLCDGLGDIKKLIAPIDGATAEVHVFEPEREKALVEAA